RRHRDQRRAVLPSPAAADKADRMEFAHVGGFRMGSGCKRDGFTLIELLVVVSIIAIIASIALPSFVRSRANANEGAIIATVRSIAEAEFQFKTLNLVDLDRNNAFEFGTLGEITGSRYLRGSVEKLAPRLLSESLGAVNTLGRLTRHGYLLALYLPDAA